MQELLAGYKRMQEDLGGAIGFETDRRLKRNPTPENVTHRYIFLNSEGYREEADTFLDEWRDRFDDPLLYELSVAGKEIKRDDAGARTVYERGAEKFPEDVELLNYYFRFLTQREDFENALKIADKLIPRDPAPKNYIRRAFVKNRLQKPDYSDDVVDAIRINPEETEQEVCGLVMETLLRSRGNIPTAKAILEVYMEHGQKSTNAYRVLAALRIVSGDMVGAKEAIGAGLDAAETEEDSHMMAATLTLTNGNVEEARDFLDRLETRTGKPQYRALSDFIDTREMIRRALSQPPRVSTASAADAIVKGNVLKLASKPRGQGTFQRDAEKAGRNDPCRCGSGKKFKRCCGKH